MVLVRNYHRYRTPSVLYRSLAEFYDSPITPGIQVIPCGKHLLEVMLSDRGATTTIVIFHAAAGLDTELPLFVGQQLTNDLDANIIFVSDPLLGRDSPIGWFTGAPDLALQDELVKLIKHIQSGLKYANHLCFYGPSAGGFAALYFSHHFPHSLAISANPQTNICNYQANKVKEFLDSSWAGASISEIPATTNLLPMYTTSFPNHVAYLQCVNDTLHLEKHARPWAKATEKYADRRAFIVDDWGAGHAPPPAFLLRGILEYAVALGGDWPTLLADELFTPELPE
ncbi:hypothetical protein [Corynebacterium pseudogenitalium]|uniref:hypothetical protein n=1 Tax=Corynebacterium pseudogenitalium TaxID=38303 RepID=UPI00210A8F2C|nr:hypothetical protein [Corynebacterium pseudogenitalium]UUA86714.1 hypothetical protein KBP54_08075 [Corynebacterium pseudogenitalium]